MRMIVLIMISIFALYAQDEHIKILEPNRTYTFNDTMIIFTQERFIDVESDLEKYDLCLEQIQCYESELTVVDSIITTLKNDITTLEKQYSLCKEKNAKLIEKDSLCKEKVDKYLDLNKTLTQDLKECEDKPSFGSNLTWFNVGAITGACFVFIGALVL